MLSGGECVSPSHPLSVQVQPSPVQELVQLDWGREGGRGEEGEEEGEEEGGEEGGEGRGGDGRGGEVRGVRSDE